MTQEQILISAAALHEATREPAWSIIDCRFNLADVGEGRRQFEQGHIPGAVYLDLDRDLASPVGPGTGRHPLPDSDFISARLGELGISNTDTIAVYDAGNGSIAARAWWVLRWLGHKSVFLLDGGFALWEAKELPIETDMRTIQPVSYTPCVNASLVLTTEELAADLPRIRTRHLLDARDRPRFRGEVEPIDPIAGHVPGAQNLPFTDFLAPDGSWKPLAERAALLESVLGDSRETAWSVMCGSGVTACHLAISGLEAGFREPQLYVGSWSEWIRDPERPVGTGEA